MLSGALRESIPGLEPAAGTSAEQLSPDRWDRHQIPPQEARMPRAIAMGTRVEQSGKLVPRAGRAGYRHLEDLADPLHRLSPAAQDLQIIIPRRNRALLLQGEFWITHLVHR